MKRMSVNAEKLYKKTFARQLTAWIQRQENRSKNNRHKKQNVSDPDKKRFINSYIDSLKSRQNIAD
jgi:hypothetical protein